MTSPPPERRPRRRRWLALAAVLFAIAAGLAGLPWLVGSGMARPRVLARINRAFAPGRLEFASLRVSWFAPTRIEDFALLDPSGHRVATGRTAVIDRTFGGLLLGKAGPVTLTLDAAALEVERAPDGQIDLVEALRTLIEAPDPDRDLVVKIAGGTLRFRDPALAEPVVADRLDLALHIAPTPRPLTWDLKLAKGDAGLAVQGDFDRWRAEAGAAARPELQFGVLARGWPFDVGGEQASGTGKLEGSAEASRKRGRWKLSGDAKILQLAVVGPALRGDSLALDRLDAGWDLAQGDEGWAVRRLTLNSAIGDLKAEGQLAGAGKQRIEGRLDLAAIARQLPRALRLREGLKVDRGSARLTVDVESSPARSSYDVEARLADLAAMDGDRPLGLRDPATISGRVIRDRGGETRVEQVDVKASFLDLHATGRLDEGVALVGALDLAAFRRQLGDWVDLGKLDLAGRVELNGIYQARKAADSPYQSGLNVTIRDLRVAGAGPSPIRSDLAILDLTATGQAEASGLPRGFDLLTASASSASGMDTVKLELRPRPTAFGVLLTATGPSPSARIGRRLSALVRGDWTPEGRALTLDAAEVRIDRDRADPPGPAVAFRAKGRLDLASGSLDFEALPSDVPTVFVIGPDGVHASGLGGALAALRVDGEIKGDLAPFGLDGRWAAIAAARGDGDGVQVSAKLAADPPAIAPGASRASSLALRGHYAPGGDRVDLTEFTVATAYGTLDASGKVDEISTTRRLDLRGNLAPDFAAITALLARKVEPGARIEGSARKFRAVGPIGEGKDWLGAIDGEVGFDLALVDIYGMRFGRAPVVLRADRGKLRFEPIVTTLNEGHVRLEPEVDLDDPAGPTLRLGKNSAIRDARINDEVVHRVLAYVAPILDQSTRASGRVSMDLDHAEIPLGPGRGRQAKLEGAVVFEDVEFAPGPLANDLLNAVGRRETSLKLDRPITLTIADGRVNQRGLALPIGDLTRIELAGWVDFERNLSLVASLPVTPAMLGNNELLADIAAGTTVKVPITGTLDRPTIDRDALGDSLREMGRSLLTRGATRGALELLRRIGQGRDPNAPPPPTPEQRKALRQERRAEKKADRDGLPPPVPRP